MNEIYNPTPKGKFPYTMQTTGVMEHSRGIAWTANLMVGEVVIGTIEQDGDGGADRVYINGLTHRQMWEKSVKANFGGNEEDATYFLLVQEEGE
jgi:hypothetical protein